MRRARTRRTASNYLTANERLSRWHVPLEHGLQFIDEIAHILELAINAGEANVRDLIDIRQPLHDQFTDLGAVDLRFAVGIHLALHLRNDRLNLLVLDRSLPTRLGQSSPNFLAAERLANAILLHDLDVRLFQPFVAGKSPLAMQTLAPPTNDIAVFAGPAVHDPVLIKMAKGTPHGRVSRARN